MAKMMYAVLGLLLFTHASARGGGGGGGGGRGGDTSSGCSSDSDCTKARKPVCDTGSGSCVAGSSDSGGSSSGGCTADSECTKARKPFCDVASGGCVKDDPTPSESSESSEDEIRDVGTCASTHRHRQSWSSLNNGQRSLYIDGFKKLADQGITQQFTKVHNDDSEHSNAEFLPWHREYIWMMESAIRGLGGEFECFAMPYWDWTDEPTPDDVEKDGATLFITDSGLGGDGDGQCLTDSVWGEDGYSPHDGKCLERDLDYPDETNVCTWSSPAQVMDVISGTDKYKNFRSNIEGTPHAYPHICIGGDAYGHMATYSSPDDPIFYLHHTYVDYVWALWQDCNNYDGAEVESDSNLYNDNVDYKLQYRPFTNDEVRVSQTFDLLGNGYDFSYEKGPFWDNADVDSNGNCGSGNINGQWFYGESNARMALRKGDKLNLNTQQLLHLELAADDEDGDYSDPDGETDCDHRSSLEVAREMMKELKAENPDTARKDLVHEWAIEVCKYEQEKTEVGLCDANSNYAWDDCTDEAKWPIDSRTNDITISRDEMVNDPSLTECQRDSRTRMWQWAREMHQLKYLCMGCFDPFCDRAFLDGKCPLDSNAHYDDDAEDEAALSFVASLYAGQMPQMDLNVALLMVLATLALMTLFAVNRWCMAGETKKVEEARYGTV